VGLGAKEPAVYERNEGTGPGLRGCGAEDDGESARSRWEFGSHAVRMKMPVALASAVRLAPDTGLARSGGLSGQLFVPRGYRVECRPNDGWLARSLVGVIGLTRAVACSRTARLWICRRVQRPSALVEQEMNTVAGGMCTSRRAQAGRGRCCTLTAGSVPAGEAAGAGRFARSVERLAAPSVTDVEHALVSEGAS